MITKSGCLVCLVLISGCAVSAVVPEPGKIDLETALASVGRGLVKMKEAQLLEGTRTGLTKDGDFLTGLVPSEVDVVFNISASAQDATKLYVELTPVAGAAPVGGKVGSEATMTSTASRGNQITVKFRSLLFSKKTTAADKSVSIEGPTDPAILGAILDTLKKRGITVFTPLPSK